MKKITLQVIVFVLSTIGSYAQNLTLGKAINLAGKQRMLVNRIAKNYMAVGANIRSEDAIKDLDESTSLFNESHRELINFAKNKETIDALKYVDEIWNEFRVKVTSEPNLVNAETIILEARVITNGINTVVEKLEKENLNLSSSTIVNNCGRQRMLLQRLATLVIAKSWIVNYANLDKDLKETISSIEFNLESLQTTRENTEEIKEALAFQRKEWYFVKNTFNYEVPKATNVYSSTNIMTKEFDKITSLYAKLVDDGKFRLASK